MCARKFPSLTFVLALFSVIGLAACAAPPQVNKTANVSPAQAANYTLPPVSALPPAKAPVAPAAPPSLADLASGPQHFEGLEGRVILAELGNPNFRRRETPAEVWQYYGPGCILDLFLYDDASAGAGKSADSAPDGNKVAHAELRGRENAPAEAGCLSRLIDQRHRHASN